jgi:signal transduction histidine kinase
MFIQLIWSTYFISSSSFSDVRHDLLNIAQKIELITKDINPSNKKKIRENIESALNFLRDDDQYEYFVKSHSGDVILRRSLSFNPTFPPKSQMNKDRYISTKVTKCGQYWEFNLFYYGHNCDIAIYTKRHLELTEVLLPFYFISILMLIILSLFAAKVITRNLLLVVNKISKATGIIALGELGHRIKVSNSDDEIAELEKNLNYTFEQLEEAFNKVSEFSAEVAHELRTPLTAIKGSLEVSLRKNRTLDEYQNVIIEAIEEISHLHRLVDDMLLLLKPVSDYEKSLFIEVDFSKIVEDVISQLTFIAEIKNIRIVQEITSGLCCSGIKSLLTRIVFNIIHNAIEFSNEGTLIKVIVNEIDSNISMKVIDEGCGISEEDQQKIFNRFYKKLGSKGNGLGLAMVKQLVGIHSGKIYCESILDEGATFTVEIPQK